MTSRSSCGPTAAFLLLAVVLAGCGGQASSDPPGPGAVNGTPAASRPPGPIPVPRAIATREGEVDGKPVTLELSQLRRRGRVVSLEIRLRTKDEVEIDLGGPFDDGVPQQVTDPAAVLDYEFTDTLDGISLIDGVNGRRFAPARDRYNHCICDRDLGTVVLSPARPQTLSATFGAPPPDVGAVDVVIPRFGTIADVPLG